MTGLRSGELYVFSVRDGDERPAYGIVHSGCAGSVRLEVWMTDKEIVWNCMLPEEYQCVRYPSDREKIEFNRALQEYRTRLTRFENCLSEDSESCGQHLQETVAGR